MKIFPLRLALDCVATYLSGARASEGFGDASGKVLGLIPVEIRFDGHAHVQTLSARRLHEGSRAWPLRIPRGARERSAMTARKGECRIRIDVEHEQVGMLEVVGARAPRVDLERAELEQAEKSPGVVDHAVRSLALASRESRSSGSLRGMPLPGVLLEKARLADAVRAAHERERAIADVRQHALGDERVIVEELALGDAVLRDRAPCPGS